MTPLSRALLALLMTALFAIVLMLPYMAFSDDEDRSLNQINGMAKTEPVWVIVLDKQATFQAKVPRITDGAPIVCFRVNPNNALDCFYRNVNTNQIILKHLMSNVEGT